MGPICRLRMSMVVLMVLAGCSRPEGAPERDTQEAWFPRNVQGHWVLRDVHPPEVAPTFNIQAITFNPDQTYVARLVKDGNRLETNRGTYRYDGWNRRLYLHSGPDQRSYTAMVWFGSELRLEGDESQGQTGTAVMVRSNVRVLPDNTPTERRSR